MSTCLFRSRIRRIAIGAALAALGASPLVLAARRADAGGSVGPDVTVIYITGTSHYGAVGGVHAYAVGTTSCNVGTAPVDWCNSIGGCGGGTSGNDHPVIAQNVYRLKDGRFEQLGMSWLKHGFLSTNSPDGACGSCTGPPLGSDQLGVGCADTYDASLNGNRPLGMRSEVDATTGVFPYPFTNVATSNAIQQRVQVLETDLDPALNPGALYWVEAQYVTSDDAAAGNGLNNASYERVGVDTDWTLDSVSATVREKPAIAEWPVQDPTVALVSVDVPGAIVERFHVARKVTDLGGGLWHYEYAVHNLNSDRAAQAFTVTFPGTTAITNTGFRDVDHHSGEPYATTDWTLDGTPISVTWMSEFHAVDPNANALRWGTMYNFWFDADRPPTSDIVHSIDLFTPGTPSRLLFPIVDTLFADGFESGNTSSWSATVP